MGEDREILVAASLLSADFSNMARAIGTTHASRADWIHMDVMDGAFVPNLTFGPKMVHDLRPLTDLPVDVHLMIESPERLADAFVEAGADYLTFHYEATVHVERLLASIRENGAKPGISIVPSTPVSALTEVLEVVDLVLVMTVNPGFGGQVLMPRCLKKIRQLAQIREQQGYNYLIEVDGGINRTTVHGVVDAGAEVLVSGSALFSAEDPASEVEFFKNSPRVQSGTV